MKQLKILSVGDETVRTSHNYLPKIAKCDDLEIVAGTVFRQGASLHSHLDAFRDTAEDYTFVYNNEGSVRFNTVENCSPAAAADWFMWDYIIIQLNINCSESSEDIVSELAGLIKNICPSARVLLSAPYGADDVTDKNASYLTLPVAKACIAAENAGVSLTEDDGTLRGREYDFITAGVWYEALSGNALTANSYRLPFVAGELTAVMKNAVHNTVNGMKKKVF